MRSESGVPIANKGECLSGRTVCWMLGSILSITPLAAGGPMTEETVKAFLQHVQRSQAYPPEAKAFVSRAWDQRGEDDDGESFIAESLAVLSATFRAGLDAYDEEQYARAYEVLSGLSDDADPYLAANASVFAIKALVEQDRLLEARDRLDNFIEDPTAVDLYTVYAAEMAYLRGYLALRDLEYDAAAMALNAMLQQYPDAGQRLRVSARQILAELRRRRPERIGDVADLMDFAGRRLGHLDTGQRVRARQQRAIELLERLIEEAEQQEQSSAQGGSGSGSGSPQGGRSPSSPMPDSMLPGGGGQEMQLRSSRRARPGEAWGTMPPAERERILQQLRDSFPSRYRQLVEQYYEELGKQP